MFADDPNQSQIYVDFMNALQNHPTIVLAVDDEKLIWKEYEDHIKPPRFGRKVLTKLLLNRRIKEVSRMAFPGPVHEVFRDLPFDKSDQKFVRTAASTDSKRLVAEEPHFSGIKRCVKKHMNVRIISAADAKALL